VSTANGFGRLIYVIEVADVSIQRSRIHLQGQVLHNLDLLSPEDGGNTHFRNIVYYSAADVA
jgi:hypothetical protein